MVRVGIMAAADVSITFIGRFTFINTDLKGDGMNNATHTITGCHKFSVKNLSPGIFSFMPINPDNASFYLSDVTIGINFHWQRREEQQFKGSLTLHNDGKTITVINIVPIEEYLKSVITSEMSTNAPLEFLKAHAIISRTWVMNRIAIKKRKQNTSTPSTENVINSEMADGITERIRWYDNSEHLLFDVCADDHCQRYQGVTKISNNTALEAINATKGLLLTYNGEIIDARFSKCCGGAFETFENCWDEMHMPYLCPGRDNIEKRSTKKNEDFFDLTIEENAQKWIVDKPTAFCNTQNYEVLRQVLNNYDLETPDFYRWKIEYSVPEISEIIKEKSGIDFGEITELVPMKRGVSGRIIRLLISGTKRSMIIGKELEIRRILSRSHLYSSAFIVTKKSTRFTIQGAGWGHGVGLCQIGAAIMAHKGYTYSEILSHYYPGSSLNHISQL